MPKIRVIIIDDEAPARRKIRRFLEAEPDIEILAESEGGAEAVEAINLNRPDLVFLDVQMPGLDGFDVAAALDLQPTPYIVFITAHDQYALRAFEVQALDYLLKPFDRDRFSKVLSRVREQLPRNGRTDMSEQLNRLLAEIRSGPHFAERLLVDTNGANGSSLMLAVEDITWVEAARNYININAGGSAYLMRGTIEGLSRRLDPARFLRINRSQVVNLDCVKELRPWFHGEYQVVLKDGTVLTWTRRYLDRAPESLVLRL